MDNFNKKIAVLNLIAQYLLVIIGCVGFILILIELSEFKKQNENSATQTTILDNTLRQTYRPLGVARTSWDDKSLIIVQFSNANEATFSFSQNIKLKNLGSGLLMYDGYAALLTVDYLNINDFREKIISGALINKVKFPELKEYKQRTPIMPGETFPINIYNKDVPYSKEYYLYVMYLYEDQDGNLYDTIHLEVLSFTDPEMTKNGWKVFFNKGGESYINESYKYYSTDDRNRLCQAMGYYSERLSKLICR